MNKVVIFTFGYAAGFIFSGLLAKDLNLISTGLCLTALGYIFLYE